jgi:hypothetical protein
MYGKIQFYEVGLSRACGALLPAVLGKTKQALFCLRFSFANPRVGSAPTEPRHLKNRH